MLSLPWSSQGGARGSRPVRSRCLRMRSITSRSCMRARRCATCRHSQDIAAVRQAYRPELAEGWLDLVHAAEQRGPGPRACGPRAWGCRGRRRISRNLRAATPRAAHGRVRAKVVVRPFDKLTVVSKVEPQAHHPELVEGRIAWRRGAGTWRRTRAKNSSGSRVRQSESAACSS